MNTSPCIILANPQLGENIGATARAMANFGLSDLRLVTPRDGWPNQRAIELASGAFDHMPEPTTYNSVKDSIHDCKIVYATTARQRDMVKSTLSSAELCAHAHAHIQAGDKIGFLFGPERTGLENDDLALCDIIINIPTNPAFSSLNLAQAVLLIVSQINQGEDLPPLPRAKDSPLATKKDVTDFLDRLGHELDTAEFFKSEGLRATMVRNIQNIFTRNDLTEQEVRTLHGVLSALIGK